MNVEQFLLENEINSRNNFTEPELKTILDKFIEVFTIRKNEIYTSQLKDCHNLFAAELANLRTVTSSIIEAAQKSGIDVPFKQ